jgi:NitT/TauT family transport system ATP-binding protein
MSAVSRPAAPSDHPPKGIAVALHGVGKRFGARLVLDDVSLTVARGEIVALVGPSGCGKSTLLRIVAGLESADTGRVLRAEGDIGYVFQDATLAPWRNVADNVRLPFRLAGRRVEDEAERVAAALALVGLGEVAGLFPRQLSGGMRMRVAIARALVGRPQILLMDEPFGALDEITRAGLDEDLLGLRARGGFSCVFVTHSVGEAVRISDRVAVMATDPGRVVATFDGLGRIGSPEERGFRAALVDRTAEVSAALSRCL